MIETVFMYIFVVEAGWMKGGNQAATWERWGI
jgi:hypothetical protein